MSFPAGRTCSRTGTRLGASVWVEALRRGQEEAGRSASVLGLFHRLGRGQLAVWTGLAFWRMITMNPYNFIVLGLGLFELVIAARLLLQPVMDGHA